jgi:hypothetical protein
MIASRSFRASSVVAVAMALMAIESLSHAGGGLAQAHDYCLMGM